MKLNWHDSLDIAIALAEKHPDVDVQYIRFTDLHRYVCELEDFVGEPDKSNEAILEAIQMAWLEELDWYHPDKISPIDKQNFILL